MLQHGFWSGTLWDQQSLTINFPISYNGCYNVQLTMTDAIWVPTGDVLAWADGLSSFKIGWWNTTSGSTLKGVW
jgi:hypothetical protein